MMSFLRKLVWLTQRTAREAELRQELEFHLKEEAAQRQEQGLSEHEAHWAARRELGNVGLVQEDTRGEWGWTRLEQVARDASYGLRQLRRNPVFSAIAIATLALGIGGIAAIFSAVDAVLIRSLPYAHANRLVMIWNDMGKSDARARHFPTPAEWLEWRRLNTVFTDTALTQPANATLSGDAEPEQVPALKATWNLLNVLGVKPAMGRMFTEDEDVKGVPVVLISHGLWMRRYGGSPDVLGRKITMNDHPYEVIGVMSPEFYFLPARDIGVWMPTSFPPWMRTNLSWHDAQVVARLKPGVTLEHAQQSMAALSRQVTAKDFRGPRSAIVRPLREDMTGQTQTALVALLCASAALLLIACVNLANLLMSRSTVRSREVAVRAALGAGRGRLVRQFLTESFVLAAVGTIAGLGVAMPAMRFLEKLVPETMGAARLTLDWRVTAFSAVAAITATLLFGLAPALRSSRFGLPTGLREAGRGATGARTHWLQHSLIVVETALAVALLTTGGLLLQTFQHLRNLDLGLRSEKLLTFETPLFRYEDFDKRVAFVNAQLEQIRAIPGVVSAGAISRIPLTELAQATFYLLAGQTKESIPQQVALSRVVSRDYFRTLGAELRAGRFFEISDRRSESPAAIVNESFADRHFAGRSAVGAQFKFGRTGEKGYWYTVVGVVKDIRDRGVTEEFKPTIYRLHEQADQTGDRPSGIVVRTTVEPSSIIPAVRQAVWSVDKHQPVWRIQTLQDIVDQQLSTPTQSTALLNAFALLALLLASLGLYGVLSYAVTQRTNEIGVRMALGATSNTILLSFGKRGLALTLVGLIVGVALAAISSRSMTMLLYGFQPDFARSVSFVALILLGVAALACFVPAHRASRIAPAVALRNE